MIWGLVAAAIALAADQVSKFYIANEILDGYSEIILAPFFSLVRAWNTGVSFSLFNDWGKFGVYALSALAAAIVALLLWFMHKEDSKFGRIGFGLIVGGAVGNIIDRIMFGAVFDFLDFHIGEYHWPAFNLADTFICVGAMIIFLAEFLKNRKKEKK